MTRNLQKVGERPEAASRSRLFLSMVIAAGAFIIAASICALWRGSRPFPATGRVAIVPSRSGALAATSFAKSTSAVELGAAILSDSVDPDVKLTDVRLVDEERRIACGSLIAGGQAFTRRFVWISRLRLIVVDDGGQDFANLVTVCNGPVSTARRDLSEHRHRSDLALSVPAGNREASR